jgi:peptide deformylase
MAILPIIVAPDPRLKAKCEPVAGVDSEIVTLMDDLLETMYVAPGIGLAAPQVNVRKRVLVVDFSSEDGPREPLCLANPEIVAASEELCKHDEGCLSLPKHYAEVVRPARVSVRYLDRDNQTREIEADGMLAVCLQHEIDHLDGILFVDHVSALKRGMILRKLRKFKKQGLLAAE